MCLFCSFDTENKDKFFDNAARSRIVNFILRRKPFSSDKGQAFSFGKTYDHEKLTGKPFGSYKRTCFLIRKVWPWKFNKETIQ